MKTAIVGAGKMGQWFMRFFLKQGDDVIVSSRNKEKLARIRDEFGVEIADNVGAVKDADRVLICVPIEDFENVVKEIGPYIRPNQVVMDICSVKKDPVRILHEYIRTGTTLGTHPVFGPGAEDIQNQNFVLTPTNRKERLFAEELKVWLEKRQANVFVMSPTEHDEIMSIVLGFPHFIGLVVCDTLLSCSRFSEARKVAGPSYRILSILAEAIACEETGFYTSLQMDLPEIERIESLFLEKTNEWLSVVGQKDRSAFTRKMELVKARLREANPGYLKSYRDMYRILDAVKG